MDSENQLGIVFAPNSSPIMNRTKPIPTHVSKFCSYLGGALIALGAWRSASAKTFVIPHVLEKSGLISNTTNTFDTTLVLTYNGTLYGTDKGVAQVELYLYDDAGQLMHGTGQNVCGPCTYNLSAQKRKLSIRIDDLITGNGGGFELPNKTGFAIIVVNGSGADAVNLQGFVVNSHTSAFDDAVFGYTPQLMTTNRPPPGTPSTKKAFCFPHVLETSGRTMTDPNAVDSILYATYSGGLTGVPTNNAGATLEFYLYDQQTGQPMLGAGGTAVCNPCTYNLGAGGSSGGSRKQTIYVDDLITAAGGFGGATTKAGFGIMVVSGSDPDGVNLQGFVVNSHTGPFDLSVFGFEPQPLKSAAARTYVIPHILEKSGLVSTQTFTFDTTLVALYSSGIGGLPPGAGASVDLYLYDDSGALMTGSSGSPICDPCTYNLGTGPAGSGSPRKQSIRIDDLIATRGGGFDTAEKTGFAVLVVGGADPDGVNLQGFVVNSHTGPFDLSVFGFDPQPITAAGLALSDDGTSGLNPRAFVIPHVLETSGTILTTQFSFDTTLYATYAGGLPGTVSSNGATAKLYLYDSLTGQLLKSALNEDVCNPCMFDLSTSARKASIRIDDLIVANHGFGTETNRNAFGVVVMDGDTANAKLQGFVVNAHTSPFDLSVFGFEPQPLSSARMMSMPITINNNGGSIQISLQTVIGGHYTIEGMGSLGGAWGAVVTFDGDGTVQTKTVPVTGSSQQFLRVKGS
jgi:hypothetical protein